MALWDWTELCHALRCPPRRGPDVDGIQFDTRKLQSGELFIALPGDPGPRFHAATLSSRDGHDFLEAASNADAAGAVVNRPDATSLPTLRVSTSTIDAFWRIALHRRRQIRGPVIAITGSSGKTTMTSFVSTVLGLETPAGSFNNYIGVPYRLANTPRGQRAVVVEIGMNHPGEIAPLARLAAPDIAVVLNVLPVHAENFDSIDGIRAEKFSIGEGLSTDGVLVHSASEAPTNTRRTVTFGKTDADVSLVALEGDLAEIDILGTRRRLKVPGGGEHRAMTVAATAAVIQAADLDLARLDALELVEVPAGRGQIARVAGIDIIDESYNANPTSTAAALTTVSAMPTSGRRIAVLGEMLELGVQSARFHAELGPLCDDLDGVVGVGEGIRDLLDALPASKVWGYHPDSSDVLDGLVDKLEANDLVLVKGSNRVFWIHNFVPRLKEALMTKFAREHMS